MTLIGLTEMKKKILLKWTWKFVASVILSMTRFHNWCLMSKRLKTTRLSASSATTPNSQISTIIGIIFENFTWIMVMSFVQNVGKLQKPRNSRCFIGILFTKRKMIYIAISVALNARICSNLGMNPWPSLTLFIVNDLKGAEVNLSTCFIVSFFSLCANKLVCIF